MQYPDPPLLPLLCPLRSFSLGFCLAVALTSSSSSSTLTSPSSAATPPSTPGAPSVDWSGESEALSEEGEGRETPETSFERDSDEEEEQVGRGKQNEEQQYLDLARRILDEGELRPTVKNGVGAKAIFAPPPLRISLSSPCSDPFDGSPILHVPLLSTKSLPFSTIANEFLWMLSTLATRTYLDSRGLTQYDERDLGPVYGHQWRFFGAEYETCESGYEGKGVDQIKEVVRQILEEPEKRRKIVTAWNPVDVPNSALPPCPVLIQFYVHSSLSLSPSSPSLSPSSPARLSSYIFQRSADVALGLPFDLVSLALLTHTIAHLTSLVPHEMVYQLGDAHVYKDHEEGIGEQLGREVKEGGTGWPEVRWRRGREEIEREGGVDAVRVKDWEVRGYEPAGRIKFKLHP